MSKQYWIQYDSNDVIKKSEFVFDDETLFLQIPTPKEGYTFVGWINKDNKIIIGEYTPTCDETLKPLWIPNYLDYKLTSDGVCKIKFKKNSKETKIIIPFGVNELLDNAFKNCSFIEEVVIPKTITSINKSAFENCKSLKKINFPKSIEKISVCAFSNCTSLESCSFEEGLKVIDNCAFYNCSSLKEITIPSTVKIIGQDSFKHCTNLQEITVLNDSIKYGKEAFFQCTSLQNFKTKSHILTHDDYKKIFNSPVSVDKLDENPITINSNFENNIELDKKNHKEELIEFFKSKYDVLLQNEIDCNDPFKSITDDFINMSLQKENCVVKWILNFKTKENKATLNDTEFNFITSTIEERFNEILTVFSNLTNNDSKIESLLKTISENQNDENIKDSSIDTLDKLEGSIEYENEINQTLQICNKNKTEHLKNELQDSIKRSIFISKEVLEAFNKYGELKDSIDEVLDKMMKASTTDLFKYFVDKKRLIYLGDLLKIRIQNNYKHRLLFCFGTKINNARKDDIYLVCYDIDHKDFNQYKNMNPNSISYTLYRFPFSLDKTQKQISNQINKPLICLGCAGSGKTLISASMYSNIVTDKFKNKPQIKPEDLLYLTYNEQTLRNAKDLIKSLTTSVINVSSINDFFKQIIKVNFKLVQEDDFYAWWNDNIENNNLTNHIRNREINNFKSKYTSRFVYILFRGIYKGSLINWNTNNIKKKNLSNDDFINECKNQESSMSIEDIQTMIFIFKQYQNHLEENDEIDDNDLARLVSNRQNKDITFDRLIIDEVQDLTERQLEAIISCSKEYKLYLFGDQNQSINPTILDVNKIEGCFTSKNKQINKSNEMKKSYRFTPRLATYINHLNSLRDKKIGSTGVNNIESSAIEEDKQKHKAGYCLDTKLGLSFLKRSINTPYSRIIVPDVETKNELIKQLGEKSETRILTIFESKGLEWDYIILYHLLSENQNEILEILQDRAKKSTLHRMIFNEFYVGCTRAKYSFVILEDNNINQEIKNNFLVDPISKITSEKEITFYLGNNNTPEDWFKEALKDFKNEQYKSAKADFINSDNIEKYDWIELCEIMMKKKYSLNDAIKMKERIETLPQAVTIYNSLGNQNQVNLLKSRLREKNLNVNELDAIFKNEILNEQEKQHIFETYKTYYEEKLKDMSIKFKRIKERIENLK